MKHISQGLLMRVSAAVLSAGLLVAGATGCSRNSSDNSSKGSTSSAVSRLDVSRAPVEKSDNQTVTLKGDVSLPPEKIIFLNNTELLVTHREKGSSDLTLELIDVKSNKSKKNTKLTFAAGSASYDLKRLDDETFYLYDYTGKKLYILNQSLSVKKTITTPAIPSGYLDVTKDQKQIVYTDVKNNNIVLTDLNFKESKNLLLGKTIKNTFGGVAVTKNGYVLYGLYRSDNSKPYGAGYIKLDGTGNKSEEGLEVVPSTYGNIGLYRRDLSKSDPSYRYRLLKADDEKPKIKGARVREEEEIYETSASGAFTVGVKAFGSKVTFRLYKGYTGTQTVDAEKSLGGTIEVTSHTGTSQVVAVTDDGKYAAVILQVNGKYRIVTYPF